MTTTAKVIVAAQELLGSPTLLYTSPASGKGTWIDKATCTNHQGAAQNVTFYLVPQGGSAGNSNLLVYQKVIADKATDLLPELVGKFMQPGDMIYGSASIINGVNVAMNGREVSA